MPPDYRMTSLSANRGFQLDISKQQSCSISDIINRSPLLICLAKVVSQWEAAL